MGSKFLVLETVCVVLGGVTGFLESDEGYIVQAGAEVCPGSLLVLRWLLGLGFCCFPRFWLDC